MCIIGIVTRQAQSSEGHKINIMYNDIIRALSCFDVIPIGLVLDNKYKEKIDLCDGIIFQGGDDYLSYEIDALRYIHFKDIPVLGICLGMQTMGMLFDGLMIDVLNHKKRLSYAHIVKIKRNSKLYNIFKSDIIKVNSRHKSAIKNTKLDISGISSDGLIEAIEDKNKRFFIGVQWHPESMIDYDENQKNLFKSFIKICALK